MSMAAKLSDLVDETSGANLQMECDFNGRIRGNTPTLLLLDGPPCGGYAA